MVLLMDTPKWGQLYVSHLRPATDVSDEMLDQTRNWVDPELSDQAQAFIRSVGLQRDAWPHLVNFSTRR